MALRFRPIRHWFSSIVLLVLALSLVAASCSRTDAETASGDPEATATEVPVAATESPVPATSIPAPTATPAPAEGPVPATPESGSDNSGSDTSGSDDSGSDSSAPVGAPKLAPASLAEQRGFCDHETATGFGLTETGKQMFADRLVRDSAVPEYRLAVDIDPASGALAGSMWARIPAADDEPMAFRMFPGMEAFESGLTVSNVVVNGIAQQAYVDTALVQIPPAPPPGSDGWQVVEMDFAYTLQASAANNTDILGALTGYTLEPDQVGLLGRTESGAQLGHWFPVWLPPVARADADPSGFGDIGAFPAASICAAISVPTEYELITGGRLLSAGEIDDRVVRVEGAVGIRDLALLVTNTLDSIETEVDGVTVRAWGPRNDPEANQTVLDFSVASQAALVDAFGPYPWTEVEIVSAPLGSGVGGMEWPGMVWIESNAYVGGLPGLGDMGGLFESEAFAGVLESMPGGEALSTTLEWTIAHELGHEWFHALVGNDSITSPAVDEPLAQLAACVAMIDIHPDNWRDICEAQTIDQYAQARGALGLNDAPADQASDEFESALQYGTIVYGKAPGFYFETAELIGWDAMVNALRSFVEENSFELVGTDALRQHLIDAGGADGEAIGELWDRWFRGAHGDEDIGVDESTSLGLPGGMDIEDLLGGGDGASIEDLLGGGDGASIEDLLGDNEELGSLLEDMLRDEDGLALLFEELLGG